MTSDFDITETRERESEREEEEKKEGRNDISIWLFTEILFALLKTVTTQIHAILIEHVIVHLTQ